MAVSKERCETFHAGWVGCASTMGCRQSLGAETRRQELALGAAAGSALAGEALLNNS